MTLTLHELKGWYYLASIDGGPVFELGYHDVEDYCAEHKINTVINKSGD